MIPVCEAIKKGKGKAQIRGWVYRLRKHAEKIFFLVRDSTGIIQCIVEKEKVPPGVWQECENASVESSIAVEGELFPEERAPGKVELKVSSLKLVQKAERFPISRDLSEEFLLDVRHLWLRSRKLTNIFKVRHHLLACFREFFEKEGYWEVSPPIITGTSCEGGATLFTLDYFGEPAYLSQSAQLYLEAMIFSLEKVWSLTPSFRAEPSRTSRHLAEYWHLEQEAAWMNFDELLDFIERMLCFVLPRLARRAEDELIQLGREPKEIEVKPPFPRLTYEQALEKLKKQCVEVPWGKDLRTIEEEALTKGLKTPVFVTRYPKEIKAFYMKNDPEDDRLVLCTDLLAPEGYGEIVGGSERETNVKILESKLLAAGEKLENYKWYLDLRRYGSVPHSGFGLGIERVLRWVCKLDHIRDAIPFPRTIRRSTP